MNLKMMRIRESINKIGQAVNQEMEQNGWGHVLSILVCTLLAALFLCILVISVRRNVVDMMVRVGWAWRHPGNYVGLWAGFVAYIFFLFFLIIPRVRQNLKWFMKFTHELTHTLVALLFFAKIKEFVVKDRECYVQYKIGPIGNVPTALSPYCIPIYTIMLFPFRFVGDAGYMIVFDALIAFTYAFHVHTFIMQTRITQSDIKNCGPLLSASFITFVHLAILSLILAIPKGGVLNAVCRVFWEYLWQILMWFKEIVCITM